MYLYLKHPCAKSLQLCLTLCDPMDSSLPGSSAHRILQARILAWVAISYSRGPSWPRGQTPMTFVSWIVRSVVYPQHHLGSVSPAYFSLHCLGSPSKKHKHSLRNSEICVFHLLLFSHSVVSDSLQPHGLRHSRLPCLSSSPGAWSNWCPLSQWCHPTVSSSVVPCKETKSVNPKRNQSWLFTGGTDAEAPILWPPDTKSRLIRKYSDAGEDWRQEEKCLTKFFIWLQSKINHVTLDMSFGLFWSQFHIWL